MIECEHGKKNGAQCPFTTPRLDDLLEHLNGEHGGTSVPEGTIASGADIGLDPRCRWLMAICRNPEGAGGCGEMRWVRYYGQVRNPSSKRMCLPCNRRYASRFVFGYRGRLAND